MLDGTLDFAITLNGEEHPKLVTQQLMDDQVYLCVADTLLLHCYGEESQVLKEKGIQGVNVKDFSKLPFCIFENRMGRQIQQCFDAANIVPNAYITSTFTQIGTTICFQRLAACFLSQSNLVSQQNDIPPDINIFPLYYKGQPLTQRLSLIRMKDRYLSHYSIFFWNSYFSISTVWNAFTWNERFLYRDFSSSHSIFLSSFLTPGVELVPCNSARPDP